MRILAIDPGSERSAFLLYDCETSGVIEHDISANDDLVYELSEHEEWADLLVVEMIASYGMPVGAEVFDTCVWIGRFVQAWRLRINSDRSPWARVYRKDVKMHLCGSMRAKDPNIRQALIDRFGGKEKAIGKKANPGPLYGIKKDLWQALAVAVTFADTLAPAPVKDGREQ